MRVCAISSKECWRDQDGNWFSDGGFPLQMAAIGSLFDQMTLMIVEVPPKRGGLRLPPTADIVTMPNPRGRDTMRKLDVAVRLPAYTGRLVPRLREADVVHVPLPGDLPLVAMLVAVGLRKPLIARYGGSWSETGCTTRMNRVTKRLISHFAGGRNVMLVAGNGAAPPAPRVGWIFSTALTSEEIRQIHAETDRGLQTPARLIYAGRLAPEKGVDVLIRAVASLKQEAAVPPPHVALVGDGPERTSLQRLASDLGCTDQFMFAGQMSRPDLSAAFQRSDLCVQPSRTEGFSKAWLDAMVHGVPVISSNVGAASTVVADGGERGWLVPPDSPQALAQRLTHVLQAPIDWPALRRRCRTFAEGCTLEAWAESIGKVCASQWGWNLRQGKLVA